MSKTPRQRAEACFSVARSTTHDGERENAIGRGEAICKRHGLDLDHFDIPGRVRKAPLGGMRGGSFDVDLDPNAGFTRRESAFSSSQDDLFSRAYGMTSDDLAAALDAMMRTTRADAFRKAYQRPPESRQCPTCGHYKSESRFGAACYDCSPPTIRDQEAARPYASFREFGTINRPTSPRRPAWADESKCSQCGHVSPAIYPAKCPKCGA